MSTPPHIHTRDPVTGFRHVMTVIMVEDIASGHLPVQDDATMRAICYMLVEELKVVAKLKEGDRCKLWNDDYLDLKINKILPKGSHGRRCILVECLASGGCTLRILNMHKQRFLEWLT